MQHFFSFALLSIPRYINRKPELTLGLYTGAKCLCPMGIEVFRLLSERKEALVEKCCVVTLLYAPQIKQFLWASLPE